MGTARLADGLAADRVSRRARQTRARSRVRRRVDKRRAAARARYGYYQRLLARDQSEAAELIDNHMKVEAPESVYDALMLPALAYAERDRLEQRLSSEEEAGIIEATRELIADAADVIHRDVATASAAVSTDPLPGPREPLSVLGYAVNGAADEVALTMLADLLAELPITLEIVGARTQALELISLVRDRKFSVVCFADLPRVRPRKHGIS